MDYLASPTVKAFLEADDFARCILGPFGSGKSSGCIMEILRRACGQARSRDGRRHTRFAVVRNTKPQLRDTTRKTFEGWLGQFGQWRENPTEFRISAGDIDCEVLFRALDTPKDVRNLLSLELTGCYFNELREIAQPIWDGMTGRVGRYPAKQDGGPTWWGIWADSNPWHTGSWQDELFTSGLSSYKLYRQPSGLGADAENTENLVPGYYRNLCIGKDEEWVNVHVRGLNGMADQGSVFGRQVERLLQRGGLKRFQHKLDGVFTCWDLGLADATAVWWWRLNAGGVEVLDWYESQGEPLEHYWEQLDARAEAAPTEAEVEIAEEAGVEVDDARRLGLQYVTHWLPHDAANKTLASGTSVLARFLERYPGHVAVLPNLSINDGIQAGRSLLEQPGTVFHERCREGLKTLKEYRFAWDDESRCYSKQPIHNWASHTGDAWRYVANVVKTSELLTRQQQRKARPNTGVRVEPHPTQPGRQLLTGMTLDELWSLRRRAR